MLSEEKEESDGAVTPKEHIAALYKERAHNDSNSVTLSNTLFKDIATLFKGSHKYLLELLQNADDTGVADRPIRVEFTLLGQYLIVSHTGQPFSAEDVDKICDNAQQRHQQKLNDIKKTGYKGIGFKSIFSISDRIDIISGGYSFRFDKHDARWLNAPLASPYPWPIIPIWTELETLDPLILEIIGDKLEMTHFIIRVTATKQIQEELNYLVNHPDIILFLRHVGEMQLIDGIKNTVVRNVREGALQNLFINDVLQTAFLTSQIYSIPLSDEIREKLTQMSDYECPTKLKQMTHTEMIFSVPLNKKGVITPLAANPLSAYLPTAVFLDIPYRVNADFLLNADRSALLENTWNCYLIQQMAFLHFDWIRSLAKQPDYQNDILCLIGRSKVIQYAHSVYQQNLNVSYNAGFSQGARDTPCLPSETSDQLLALKHSIADTIDFWSVMTEVKDEAYPKERFVSKTLADFKTFQYFGEKFDVRSLVAKLALYAKQCDTVESNEKLLIYLKQLSEQKHDSIKKSDLLKIAFVRNSQGVFITPSESYLISQDIPELPSCIHFQSIEAQHIRDASLLEWLIQLGLTPSNAEEIVKTNVLPLLTTDRMLRTAGRNYQRDFIELTRFLFQLFVQEQSRHRASDVSTTKIKNLIIAEKRIQLITVTGKLSVASRLYLSSDYQPTLCLERFIKDKALFLSADYLLLPHDNLVDWRLFLNYLGIKDTLELVYHEHYTFENATASNNPAIQAYFKMLRQNYMGKNRKMQSGDYVTYLVDTPFFELQKESKANELVFLEQLKSYIEKPLNIEFCYCTSGNNNQPVVSFLQYQLQETASIRGHDGKWHAGKNLYGQKFKKFEILPISAQAFTPEQEVFLGLKPCLEFVDIDKVLLFLSQQQPIQPPLYRRVFLDILYLIEKLSSSQEYEKNQFKRWKGKLPAENGSLQLVSQLRYFAVPNEKTPFSASWLKVIDKLAPHQLEVIAEFFGMEIVVNITPIPEVEECVLDTRFFEECRQWVPIIAMIESEEQGKNVAELLNLLMEQLHALTPYAVSSLQLVWPDHRKTPAYCVQYQKGLYFSVNDSPMVVKRHIANKIADYLKLSSRASHALEDLILIESVSDRDRWCAHNNLNVSVYQQLCAENRWSHFNEQAASDRNDEEREETTDPEAMMPLSVREVIDTSSKSISAVCSSATLKKRSLLTQASSVMDEPTQRTAVLLTAIHEFDMANVTIAHVLYKKKEFPLEKRKIFSVSSQMPLFASAAVHSKAEGREIDAEEAKEIEKPEKLEKLKKPIKAEKVRKREEAVISSVSLDDSLDTPVFSKEKVIPIYAPDVIGQWGEQFVYQKLMHHYRLKYTNCVLSETENGFQSKGMHISQSVELIVTWANKNGESGASFDFEISKNGQKRYIEVKSTEESHRRDFFVSRREWELLVAQGNRFRFFRVFNAAQPTARIEKIKDPAEKMRQGQLTLLRAVLKI